jgi:hypothetical protein
MPSTSAEPKSADFGDWIPSSSCQVVCPSPDPMLEEAALPPLPVWGRAPGKDSRDDPSFLGHILREDFGPMGGHATSGSPDGADAPVVLVQPITVEIDGCDGAFVSSGCGPDAIQPSATATPEMAADVVKDFIRKAAAPAMVPACVLMLLPQRTMAPDYCLLPGIVVGRHMWMGCYRVVLGMGMARYAPCSLSSKPSSGRSSSR